MSVVARTLLAACFLAGLAAAAPSPKEAPVKRRAKPAAAQAAEPSYRPLAAGARRWACFYGSHLSLKSWLSLELAVVDPDTFNVPKTTGPLALAYLNVGEIDEHRQYWSLVKDKPYVIEPNPDWAKSHRVDMRSPDWQKLLLKRALPEAVKKGYRGVMLDTVDTAEYFESSAPARFAGSVEAAAEFINQMRAENPGLVILMNNGLAVLEKVEASIDGLVIEDLYTRCIATDEQCRPAPEAEAAAKEARLKTWSERTGKPVFVLVYAQLGERKLAWVAKASNRARAMGFRPYLAAPALERFGVIIPASAP